MSVPRAPQPDALSRQEFRWRVVEAVNKSGVGDRLKSQLRSHIISEIRRRSKGSFGNGAAARESAGDDDPALGRPGELMARVVDSLVVDYLRARGNEFTLSVFMPESGLTGPGQVEGLPAEWLLEAVSKVGDVTSFEKEVQTEMDDEELLEIQIRRFDNEHTSQNRESNRSMAKAIEQRMTKYQQELDLRLKNELDEQVFKEVELAHMKMEERQNYIAELAHVRGDYETKMLEQRERLAQSQELQAQKLVEREKELERSNLELRQRLLEESNRSIMMEKNLRSEAELGVKTLEMERDSLKRRLDEARHEVSELNAFKDRYTMKMQEAMAQYKIDLNVEHANILQHAELEKARVETDRVVLQERAKAVEHMMEQVKASQNEFEEMKLALAQTKAALEAAVHARDEAIHESKGLRLQVASQKSSSTVEFEIQSLKRNLVDAENAANRRQEEYQELLKKMIGPNDEVQKELLRLRRREEKWKKECSGLTQTLEAELNRSDGLQNKYDEAVLKCKEYQREIADLRLALHQTRAAGLAGLDPREYEIERRRYDASAWDWVPRDPSMASNSTFGGPQGAFVPFPVTSPHRASPNAYRSGGPSPTNHMGGHRMAYEQQVQLQQEQIQQQQAEIMQQQQIFQQLTHPKQTPAQQRRRSDNAQGQENTRMPLPVVEGLGSGFVEDVMSSFASASADADPPPVAKGESSRKAHVKQGVRARSAASSAASSPPPSIRGKKRAPAAAVRHSVADTATPPRANQSPLTVSPTSSLAKSLPLRENDRDRRGADKADHIRDQRGGKAERESPEDEQTDERERARADREAEERERIRLEREADERREADRRARERVELERMARERDELNRRAAEAQRQVREKETEDRRLREAEEVAARVEKERREVEMEEERRRREVEDAEERKQREEEEEKTRKLDAIENDPLMQKYMQIVKERREQQGGAAAEKKDEKSSETPPLDLSNSYGAGDTVDEASGANSDPCNREQGRGCMPELVEFIFLGTGTSSGIPNIGCLTNGNPTCRTCISAVQPRSKNKRRNTSGLLRYRHSDGTIKNVLIDCGKFFFEGAVDWFVQYQLRRIDAVILTHGHADAMMGLDDLRQWTIRGEVQDHIPIYLAQETMDVVSRVYPYIVDSSKATGGGHVPALNFHVFDAQRQGEVVEPFMVDELRVVPFEVEHGKMNDGSPYMCYGFRFNDFTYLSDVSKIPTRAADIMRDSRYLVIDALKDVWFTSHFGIPEAITTCLDIKPKRTFFLGFCHEVEHGELEERLLNHKKLKAAGLRVEPAYDGLRGSQRASMQDVAKFDAEPTSPTREPLTHNEMNDQKLSVPPTAPNDKIAETEVQRVPPKANIAMPPAQDLSGNMEGDQWQQGVGNQGNVNMTGQGNNTSSTGSYGGNYGGGAEYSSGTNGGNTRNDASSGNFTDQPHPTNTESTARNMMNKVKNVFTPNDSSNNNTHGSGNDGLTSGPGNTSHYNTGNSGLGYNPNNLSNPSGDKPSFTDQPHPTNTPSTGRNMLNKVKNAFTPNDASMFNKSVYNNSDSTGNNNGNYGGGSEYGTQTNSGNARNDASSSHFIDSNSGAGFDQNNLSGNGMPYQVPGKNVGQDIDAAQYTQQQQQPPAYGSAASSGQQQFYMPQQQPSSQQQQQFAPQPQQQYGQQQRQFMPQAQQELRGGNQQNVPGGNHLQQQQNFPGNQWFGHQMGEVGGSVLAGQNINSQIQDHEFNRTQLNSEIQRQGEQGLHSDLHHVQPKEKDLTERWHEGMGRTQLIEEIQQQGEQGLHADLHHVKPNEKGIDQRWEGMRRTQLNEEIQQVGEQGLHSDLHHVEPNEKDINERWEEMRRTQLNEEIQQVGEQGLRSDLHHVEPNEKDINERWEDMRRTQINEEIKQVGEEGLHSDLHHVEPNEKDLNERLQAMGIGEQRYSPNSKAMQAGGTAGGMVGGQNQGNNDVHMRDIQNRTENTATAISQAQPQQQKPAGKPRTILIAIDESTESHEALAWALENVVKSEDNICLSTLGFLPNPSWGDYFKMLTKGTKFGVEKSMELEEKAREMANDRLKKAGETIERHRANLGEVYHIQHDILAAHKKSVDPRDFILSMCRSRHANLLVVGSSGDSSRGISEHMTRYAPCPVLVVRGLNEIEHDDERTRGVHDSHAQPAPRNVQDSHSHHAQMGQQNMGVQGNMNQGY
ncbi:hypothetical protein HK101_003241 [Irineochytrium annulatum]|nr:hypothetical protein HK101_003241 [Irineochytrium annulatum]